jgi:hypothetical protein
MDNLFQQMIPKIRYPNAKIVRHQWLMPAILSTQEAEIRRI